MCLYSIVDPGAKGTESMLSRVSYLISISLLSRQQHDREHAVDCEPWELPFILALVHGSRREVIPEKFQEK